jgi:CheY-like chemotaxis protein/HPt (histidine-containing phosphotransfer) domain-containing protein
VDDNATNRIILTEILESWQMTAASATSAAEAIAAMRTAVAAGQPFHLVLTDALMPDVDGYSLAEQIAAHDQLKTATIFLLTSAGAPALRGKRADLFTSTLIKSELLDAIVTAFAAPPAATRPRGKGLRKTARPPSRALRVLVAEDNPTNQKLVSALLDQRGHHVTMVSNGRQAVERAAQESFDVILMDVQMPEMSGLEATVAIRTAERGTGRHLPIVALTARAMAGDREQCLAAGMDAYAAKPVRAEELFAAIDAIVGSPSSPSSAAPPAPAPSTPGLLDVSALLAGFGGRGELVKDVIDVFLDDAPALLDRLKQAADAGDVAALGATAHAIKGSAGLFSQGSAYEQARALEQRARGGDGSDAGRAYEAINTSLSQLMTELRTVRETL